MADGEEIVSIQPLLAALDRASDQVYCARAGELDRILISTDFREGLVASVFAASDRTLAELQPSARSLIEQTLLAETRHALEDVDARLLRGGIPERIFAVNWLSRDDLERDWGGSYDRYLRG